MIDLMIHNLIFRELKLHGLLHLSMLISWWAMLPLVEYERTEYAVRLLQYTDRQSMNYRDIRRQGERQELSFKQQIHLQLQSLNVKFHLQHSMLAFSKMAERTYKIICHGPENRILFSYIFSFRIHNSFLVNVKKQISKPNRVTCR